MDKQKKQRKTEEEVQEDVPLERSDPPVKLRPVVYTSASFRDGVSGISKELLLLRAMNVTSDVNEMKRMIGVKTVAEVYKTLDKMSMRKEYHRALSENGISFDYIVKSLKGVVESGEKDADKIKAIQTLLKSVGMDKYEDDTRAGGSSWEEALLKATETKQQSPEALAAGPDVEYEVKQPEIPEYIKKMQEEEKGLSDNLYDR